MAVEHVSQMRTNIEVVAALGGASVRAVKQQAKEGSSGKRCSSNVLGEPFRRPHPLLYSRPTKADPAPGLTLATQPTYHFNIGHALWDGLWPGYVSLFQLGFAQRDFRALVLSGREHAVETTVPGMYSKFEQLFGAIGGLGAMNREFATRGVSVCASEGDFVRYQRNVGQIAFTNMFGLGQALAYSCRPH